MFEGDPADLDRYVEFALMIHVLGQVSPKSILLNKTDKCLLCSYDSQQGPGQSKEDSADLDRSVGCASGTIAPGHVSPK